MPVSGAVSGDIGAEPSTVAPRRPRGEPWTSWSTPVILVTAVNMGAMLLLRPAMRAAMQEAPSAVRGSAELYLWLSAMVSPLVVLLKALAFAAVCWSLATFLEERPRWRALVGVMLYSEVVLSLASVAAVAVLYWRGLVNIRAAADLHVALGLDLLVPVTTPALRAVAQNTTLFHGAAFALNVFGLRRAVGLSRPVAVASAALVWGFIVFFGVLRWVAFG